MVTTTLAKRVPKPVLLPLLNKAQEPFHGSFHGTQLVIKAFNYILRRAGDRANLPKSFKVEAWQNQLRWLRDPNYPMYCDPESLQVAQLLARYDALDMWQEMGDVADLWSPGVIWETTQMLPFRYTCVVLGVKWLLDCGRKFCPDTTGPVNELFLRHLEHQSIL
jgi:hypothetical protein